MKQYLHKTDINYMDLNEILESITDGFYIIDSNWHLRHINKKCEDLFHRQRDELIGTLLWDSIPNHKSTKGYAELMRAMKERTPVNYEVLSPLQLIWLEVNAYPISSGGLAIYFRDISKRKHLEQELRESEQRFATAFGSNPTAIAITRLDGTFLEVNDTLLTMLGYHRDEVIGLLSSRHMWLYAEQRTLFVEETCRKGNVRNKEIMLRKKSGELLPVSASSDLLEIDGKPALLSTLIDISQQKHAEEALRKSMERQAFLLKLSDSLRLLYAPNDIHAAVTLAGMDYFDSDRCYYCEIENDNAVIRRDASRADLPSVAGVYPLNSLPIHKSLIEAGLPFSVEDVNTTELVDEELRQLCIQLKVISYLDVPIVKGGNPVGILCITQCNPRCWTDSDKELAREIAERAWTAVEQARTEEALFKAEREKNEALQKAIELKDEFLSIVSHEFKTPLAVINSAVQTMKLVCRGELSEKANKYLSKILQNSNRQLKLVNNLLDITRINAGSIKINRTNIEIIQTTRTITESILLYAEQKGIGLSFSSTIKKKVIGIDEEKYERILLNLLSNAIKFTPKGKSISVKASQKVVNGKCRVCIRVRDQGIGIPEDKRQLIFERFGQVDSSLSRQAEGTGIGLSLVKKFVELMGGEIALESTIGKGSTFTVLFPIARIRETPGEKMLQEINENRLIQATAIEFSDIY